EGAGEAGKEGPLLGEQAAGLLEEELIDVAPLRPGDRDRIEITDAAAAGPLAPGGAGDLVERAVDDVAEQQRGDAGEGAEGIGGGLDPQQAHQEELPGAGGEVLELGHVEVAKRGLSLSAAGDPADEAVVGAEPGARRAAVGPAEI